jgi:hypothetical protein
LCTLKKTAIQQGWFLPRYDPNHHDTDALKVKYRAITLGMKLHIVFLGEMLHYSPLKKSGSNSLFSPISKSWSSWHTISNAGNPLSKDAG